MMPEQACRADFCAVSSKLEVRWGKLDGFLAKDAADQENDKRSGTKTQSLSIGVVRGRAPDIAT